MQLTHSIVDLYDKLQKELVDSPATISREVIMGLECKLFALAFPRGTLAALVTPEGALRPGGKYLFEIAICWSQKTV